MGGAHAGMSFRGGQAEIDVAWTGANIINRYPTADNADKRALHQRYIDEGMKYCRLMFQFNNITDEQVSTAYQLHPTRAAWFKEAVEFLTDQGVYVISGPFSYMRAGRHSNWLHPDLGTYGTNADQAYRQQGATYTQYDAPGLDMTAAEHYQFWYDLISYMGDNPYFIPLLANEPRLHDIDVLACVMQDFVDACRDAGHTGHICGATSNWTHFRTCFSSYGGKPPMTEYVLGEHDLAVSQRAGSTSARFDMRNTSNGRFYLDAHHYSTEGGGGTGTPNLAKFDEYITPHLDAARAFIAAGSGVLMSECGFWDADLVASYGIYGTKQDALDFNQRLLDLVGDAAVMIAPVACINHFGDDADNAMGKFNIRPGAGMTTDARASPWGDHAEAIFAHAKTF